MTDLNKRDFAGTFSLTCIFQPGLRLIDNNVEKLVNFARHRIGLVGYPKQICNKIIALTAAISMLVPVVTVKKEIPLARESSGEA